MHEERVITKKDVLFSNALTVFAQYFFKYIKFLLHNYHPDYFNDHLLYYTGLFHYQFTTSKMTLTVKSLLM